ncbi:tyrosine-type recombinase/integrase [Citreimonas salinaria]|uniref:Site-specific recombinase XerD n=1 Tax=Citreimonas salinaria TaxID=321339 RepID=A0A1H3HR02_9RHOB|nr:tyrosine-type recombinase/integrase [Citreimonas salinaria]SDY17907.1 Site-specific recombinase XerD [Citreimonas salinaria]
MTRKNPFPGVSRHVDRHGKVHWRLRKRIKGRKIDTYLSGRYGSAEFRAAYEAALNPAPEAPKTAGDWGTFDHVITHMKGSRKWREDLSASTRYAKGKRLDWIRSLIGAARLSSFEARHLENLMDRKGGPDAANRLLKEISEIFDYAAKKLGYNVPNPTGGVEPHKTRKGGFHTWTDDEVQKFRDAHPTGSKPRLAFELMLATGAARQDACAMGRHNIKGDHIYYRRGKTGQETELPLIYMAELVAEIVQLPHGSSLFLTHSDGKPYTPESFGNWFADQCTAAGLPAKCRAHGLRKRGATILAEKGANELQIMAFLAHRSTREALRYVQAAQRRRLAAAGMKLAHGSQNVSNLSDWLGKTTMQQHEKKGK